jgi:hypothetical protein
MSISDLNNDDYDRGWMDGKASAEDDRGWMDGYDRGWMEGYDRGCMDGKDSAEDEIEKLKAENAKLMIDRKELGQIGTGLYAEVERLEAENAKLKEAAKALLDTYCDETYEALAALIQEDK